MIVALWDRERLAEDSGVEDPGRSGGFTLAYNVRAPGEVDAIAERGSQRRRHDHPRAG